MTWVPRPRGATVEVRREKGRDFLNLWAKETDLSWSDTQSHADLLRGQKCLLWKEARSTPGIKFPSTSFPHLNPNNLFLGFPRWLRGKESTCQWRRCRRHKFDPWVGKMPWKRKWQTTPIFLPGKFHEQRSLAGYNPWGHKESDTTQWQRTWK